MVHNLNLDKQELRKLLIRPYTAFLHNFFTKNSKAKKQYIGKFNIQYFLFDFCVFAETANSILLLCVLKTN